MFTDQLHVVQTDPPADAFALSEASLHPAASDWLSRPCDLRLILPSSSQIPASAQHFHTVAPLPVGAAAGPSLVGESIGVVMLGGCN